ncbi:hypothetical protein H9X95_15370 [Micromonospora chalcea]|nr:hypothetical protein [Micromonospora chalcea]
MVHHRAWYVADGGEHTTRDVVRWYRDDDSGAEPASEHPAPRPGEARDFWLVGDLHYYNLADAVRSGDFLRTRAGSQPMEALTNLAFLSRWRSPRRTGRILTAQLLADTPGLTAYPHTVDRAGRTGIAVAAINGGGRERCLLILHPSTGEVRAYELAARTATGWQARIYLLLLTRTHVERRWWEPSADGAPCPHRNRIGG